MNILEVEKVIGDLNQEIYEQIDSDYIYLEVCSNSYCILIEFLGIQLWTSDWDSREYIDVDGEEIYESLDIYLRREMNREIEKLKRIKL